MKDNALKTDANNNLLIDIELIGFCDKNIKIDKADAYRLQLKNKNAFNALIDVCLGRKVSNKDYDIKINDASSKEHFIIRKYLQQNCLILMRKNLFCDKNISVKENIKIVSQLYSGFDLSDACISSFILEDVKNESVNKLSTTRQDLMLLSYVVCCPAIIWIIDDKLLNELNEKEKSIFENAVKIRKKHGGVILIVSCSNSTYYCK